MPILEAEGCLLVFVLKPVVQTEYNILKLSQSVHTVYLRILDVLQILKTSSQSQEFA